jgi:hypothetical protein
MDTKHKATPDEYRKFLRIDRDGLDECLMEQPEVYHHVSEAFAAAAARRDKIKLDYEEAEATEDARIRLEALNSQTKLTESMVERTFKRNAQLQKMQRLLLSARAEAERWKALKEGFEQRSFMLRELVSLTISQSYDLGLERGAVKDRAASIRRQAGEERRSRRP